MSLIFQGIADRYGSREVLDDAALMDIYDTVRQGSYTPPIHTFPRFSSDYTNACQRPGGSQLATAQLVEAMAMAQFPTYRPSVAEEGDQFFHGVPRATPRVQAVMPVREESVSENPRNPGRPLKDWLWTPIFIGVIGSMVVGGAAFFVGVAVALVAYGVFELIDTYQRYPDNAPVMVERQPEPQLVINPAFEAVKPITAQILEIEKMLNDPLFPVKEFPEVQKKHVELWAQFLSLTNELGDDLINGPVDPQIETKYRESCDRLFKAEVALERIERRIAAIEANLEHPLFPARPAEKKQWHSQTLATKKVRLAHLQDRRDHCKSDWVKLNDAYLAQKSLDLMLEAKLSEHVARDCISLQEQVDLAFLEEKAIVDKNVELEMNLRSLSPTDARVEQLSQERKKLTVAFAVAVKKREGYEAALKKKQAERAIAEARAGNA